MDRAEPRSEDVEMAEATSVQPEPPATLEAYIQQVQQRRRLFEPSRAARETAKGYTIDPSGAAPHSAHIHAMAMVQDASILLSGGSDGYVRWYDLYASMNGKNMLTQNLRSSFVEGVAKGGVLTTWWGNAHLAPGEPLTRADAPLSPVHSLACERNALWGVSGGESGQINLYTLRHDPGQLRHVFRKHTAAVSALALSDSETELLSGGWDRGVYVRHVPHTAMGPAHRADGALLRRARGPGIEHPVPPDACAECAGPRGRDPPRRRGRRRGRVAARG